MTRCAAEGDRIELVEMPDDPEPIPPGAKGTIKRITAGPYPQIHVEWDDGYTLMLIPGLDVWKKI